MTEVQKISKRQILKIIDTNPVLNMRFYSMIFDPDESTTLNPLYFKYNTAIMVLSWGIGIFTRHLEDVIPLIQLIPKNRNFFLNGIEERILPLLQETFDNLIINDICHPWTFEGSFIIQETLESLTADDAEFINSIWPYRDENSIQFIERCVELLPSSVIRDNQTPIAWSFSYSQSPYHINMGNLYVQPEHRRKGFGRRITIDLVNKVNKEDKKPLVHVHIDNEASIRLLKQLNFLKHPEKIIFGDIMNIED